VRFTTNLSANSIQLSCKQFLSKYQPPCAAVKSTPLVLLVNSSCKMYACLSLPICHDTGMICSSDKFWTNKGLVARTLVHTRTWRWSYKVVREWTIFDSGIPKFQISQTRVSQFSLPNQSIPILSVQSVGNDSLSLRGIVPVDPLPRLLEDLKSKARQKQEPWVSHFRFTNRKKIHQNDIMSSLIDLGSRHNGCCAKGDTMPSSDTVTHVLHKNPIAARPDCT